MLGRANCPQRMHCGRGGLARSVFSSTRTVVSVRRPDRVRAPVHALQEVDRAVALQDSIGREACTLEMPVDVAGEDEVAQRAAFAPAAQDLEARVRGRGAIEVQAMAEEPPGLLRVPLEPDRVGDFLEPPAAKGRIGPPEPFRAAEVGQAGVDAHARPGADQQGVGGKDGIGCLTARLLEVSHGWVRTFTSRSL